MSDEAPSAFVKQPIFLDSSAFFRLAPKELTYEKKRQVFKALCAVYELHITDALRLEFMGTSIAKDAEDRGDLFQEFPIQIHPTTIGKAVGAGERSPENSGEYSIFECLDKKEFENYMIATDDISIFEPRRLRTYLPLGISSAEILDHLLEDGGLSPELYCEVADSMSRKREVKLRNFYSPEDALSVAQGESPAPPKKPDWEKIIAYREKKITGNVAAAIELIEDGENKVYVGKKQMATRVSAERVPPSYHPLSGVIRVSNAEEAAAALMDYEISHDKDILLIGSSDILLKRTAWTNDRKVALQRHIRTAVGNLMSGPTIAAAAGKGGNQVIARILGQQPSVPTVHEPNDAARELAENGGTVVLEAEIRGARRFVSLETPNIPEHSR